MNRTLHSTVLTMMALHADQVDKSGMPYYTHPLRVMVRLGVGVDDAADSERHAALLHDVIEDCGMTPEILLDMGYDQEVVDMVRLLSRDKSTTYRQFIYSLIGSGNVGAMRVKLADLYDNSSESRLEQIESPELRKEVEGMIESRYKPAIRMLREVLGTHAEGIISEPFDLEINEMEGESVENALPEP